MCLPQQGCPGSKRGQLGSTSSHKLLLHILMASCGCCLSALCGRWMSGCRTSCRMCLPQQSCPGSKRGQLGSTSSQKLSLHTKMASSCCCLCALSGRWMSGCRTSCRMCLPQQSCPGSKSGRIGSITLSHTSTHPAINRRTSSQLLAGSRLFVSVCSS